MTARLYYHDSFLPDAGFVLYCFHFKRADQQPAAVKPAKKPYKDYLLAAFVSGNKVYPPIKKMSLPLMHASIK